MTGTPRAHRLRLATAIGAILSSVVLAYAPSVDNELVFDDRILVGEDPRVREPGHLLEIWTSDYWPGDRPSFNYRPITTTSFAFPRTVDVQRWISIVLHAINSSLVLALCLTLGTGLPGAVGAGLLFAVHPLHSEAIFLIVGRGELLAAAFGLLFLLGSLRGWSGAILALTLGLALLSKESAAVLPLLALVLRRAQVPAEDRSAFRRFATRLLAWSVLPFAVLFSLRYGVFGRFLPAPGHVNPLFNPIAELSDFWRYVNGLWMIARYLLAAIFPIPLRADYSFNQLPVLQTLVDPRLLFVLGLVASTAFVFVRGRAKQLALAGLVLSVVALLPVSNLLFVSGVGYAERLAYLPLLGLCLAVADGLRRVSALTARRNWAPLAAYGVLVVALVASAAVIRQRDADWQNRDRFTSALVSDSPHSAVSYGFRGAYLLERGERGPAREMIETALAIRPSWPDAWATLALISKEEGDLPAAARSYASAAQALMRGSFDRQEIPIYYFRAAEAYFRADRCNEARYYAQMARTTVGDADPAPLRLLERAIAESDCN